MEEWWEWWHKQGRVVGGWCQGPTPTSRLDAVSGSWLRVCRHPLYTVAPKGQRFNQLWSLGKLCPTPPQPSRSCFQLRSLISAPLMHTNLRLTTSHRRTNGGVFSAQEFKKKNSPSRQGKSCSSWMIRVILTHFVLWENCHPPFIEDLFLWAFNFSRPLICSQLRLGSLICHETPSISWCLPPATEKILSPQMKPPEIAPETLSNMTWPGGCLCSADKVGGWVVQANTQMASGKLWEFFVFSFHRIKIRLCFLLVIYDIWFKTGSVCGSLDPALENCFKCVICHSPLYCMHPSPLTCHTTSVLCMTNEAASRRSRLHEASLTWSPWSDRVRRLHVKAVPRFHQAEWEFRFFYKKKAKWNLSI